MSKVGLAKITRPGVRTAVSRDRLFGLLDEGSEARLIWIAGPPGAGKTTLVGSYIESRQQPCIWYQLDRGDADIATFFYYLREAAISFGAEGGSGLPLLGPEYLDDIATFSRGFFRQLFELASDGLLLVFDNYHEVPPQSQLVEVFRDGLGEAPAGCKAMVLSRDEPPAALARLRASAALVELGWPELQLTREESDAIAIKRSPELDEDALATLYRRTAGWPAGLVLLLEHGPVDLAAIHGHESMLPQVLFDYLAGEIFEKLPTDAQEFLLSGNGHGVRRDRTGGGYPAATGSRRVLCQRAAVAKRHGLRVPPHAA